MMGTNDKRIRLTKPEPVPCDHCGADSSQSQPHDRGCPNAPHQVTVAMTCISLQVEADGDWTDEMVDRAAEVMEDIDFAGIIQQRMQDAGIDYITVDVREGIQ